MRISDWSSDVCSSDLIDNAVNLGFYAPARWLQRIRRPGTPDIPRSSGEGNSMKQVRSIPRRGLLSSALLLALAPAVSAQVAAPDPQVPQEQQSGQTATTGEVEPETLDTIVVTGIRGSLISSMNLKRDSQGIVDGIVAEDIGKFPDTNLAESLQRISGVSIDRSMGEGSKVTVRAVGPDINLWFLNGRQIARKRVV